MNSSVWMCACLPHYSSFPEEQKKDVFFHFIKGSGKDLLLDFVMQPQKRNLIFSELLFISYKYLTKVRYDIDDYFLRKNWVNLINVSYTNDIITDVSSFLTKIDEANKLEFN